MINEAPVNSQMKHSRLGLTDRQVIDMYRMMLTARKFDDRCLVLQRSGKIAFHVSGVGQETGQSAAAFAFDANRDFFLPYYRDYAFVLSVGMTVRDLMLSVFAKAEDPSSGGRQMPGHFGHRKLRIVSGSSPVATQIPQAAGIAYAGKLRNEQFCTYVSFGEGSSNQGDFHEGCNFAGVHKLPVIFFCENNQYAISTPYSKQIGEARIADRAIGYGFPGIRVDGNDALEVYRVVKEARERAMRGEGPTLIEAMMYRIPPHSTSDDDMLYRTKEEVQENRKNDGIAHLKQYLIDCALWNEQQDQELVAEITKMVNEETVYAEKAPYPAPEDTLKHVYEEESEA